MEEFVRRRTEDESRELGRASALALPTCRHRDCYEYLRAVAVVAVLVVLLAWRAADVSAQGSIDAVGVLTGASDGGEFADLLQKLPSGTVGPEIPLTSPFSSPRAKRNGGVALSLGNGVQGSRLVKARSTNAPLSTSASALPPAPWGDVFVQEVKVSGVSIVKDARIAHVSYHGSSWRLKVGDCFLRDFRVVRIEPEYVVFRHSQYKPLTVRTVTPWDKGKFFIRAEPVKWERIED